MLRNVARASIVLGLFCAAASAPAREPARPRSPRSQPVVLDVLEAEAQGLVGVKYIPNDARSAQIVVQNKSDKPLTLRLPAAFAGVPVLAQMGMGGMGGGGMGGGMGGGGMGGGAQATGGGGMGGGMGGAGMGGGGMGAPGMGGAMGGGMFAVPPETVRAIRVATVCLEHGKPEPSPRQAFKLVALESFSSDPQLAAVLDLLGRGQISQKVAQAAAWHVANGLSWDALAAESIDRAGGFPDEPYFSPAELMSAHRVVAMTRQADEPPASSPASTGS